MKSVADLKGLKMRLGGGVFGESMAKLGVVAQNMPAAMSTRRWKGHAGRGRVRRPLRRRKTRLEQGCQVTTTTGLVGRRRRSGVLHQQEAFANALSAENQAIVHAPHPWPIPTARPNTLMLNPIALKKLVAGGTQLKHL